jgi:hypothetical protein
VCSGLYRYSSIATTIIEPQCFILGDWKLRWEKLIK